MVDPKRRARYVAWPIAGSLLIAIGAINGCAPHADSASADAGSSNKSTVPPKPVPRGTPLKVGDAIPKLEAEGWINGPPLPFDASGTRLTVVDLWAHWCPYCRYGAPELVQLYKKYSAQGVVFVSLTNMTQTSVESFVKEFAVNWPSGYGINGDLIIGLGVGSGMGMPGYDVAPTIFLVGCDGRVRWTDKQARLRHTDVNDWSKEVGQAIEGALISDSPAKPK